MKIYTKTGDKGKTKLVDGSTVEKYDLRVEAYGQVDELNSYLGVVRSHIESFIEDSPDAIASDIDAFSRLGLEIELIQNQLFSIGSLLATSEQSVFEKMPAIQSKHIEQLEKWIDQYTAELPPLKNFILPAGHLIASHLHVARTVCRRAERAAVRIAAERDINSIIYMNRLSDLLFTWARWANIRNSIAETIWKKENV